MNKKRASEVTLNAIAYYRVQARIVAEANGNVGKVSNQVMLDLGSFNRDDPAELLTGMHNIINLLLANIAKLNNDSEGFFNPIDDIVIKMSNMK